MNVLILKEGDIASTIMITPALKALFEAGHSVYLIINSGTDSSNMEKLFNDLEYIEGVRGFDFTKEKNGDAIIAWIVGRNIDLCIESYPADSGFKWLFPYLDSKSIRRAPKTPEASQHEVDVNLEMVKDLVKGDASTLYSIPHYKFDIINNLLLQDEDKIKVIICPNFKKDGFNVKKNWGVENYANLINLLPSDFKAILIDDFDGIGICNHIEHLAPQALNLAGLLTLEECIAVMGVVDVIISNDSYFAHVASALNKYLLVFFDQKSWEKTRPIGVKTIILKADSPEHKCAPTSAHDGCFCIRSMPPESVYNVIVKYILPELDKEKIVQPIGV